jgi:hypothetical protein
MNGQEYIEACKNKLQLDSYYKLSNELNIRESDLTFYRQGKRLPSVYACFKIGECLGIEPSLVMADIASETEKNPVKRAYFKSFMSCLKADKHLLTLTALMPFIYGAAVGGISDLVRIMTRYVKRKKALHTKREQPKGCFFCG